VFVFTSKFDVQSSMFDVRFNSRTVVIEESSIWLHRIALLTVACTFPLIFMGGLVTSHHAGMSVPDWPNSYGYNMFLFPPRLWIGGILYEHTHRLMATVVGFVSIILTIAAWKVEQRRWVRWLATAVLGAVIFQGVLGGLRVVLVKLDLAIVHACFAQAFFCLSALTAIVTSRWWFDAPNLSTSAQGRRTITLAITAVLIVYGQLMIGAIMRHYNAGLAIPDVPWAYGKVLPPLGDGALSAVNRHRIWDLGLEPVTLGQIWLHFGHRIGALVVSIALITLIAKIVLHHRDRGDLVWPAVILAFLLIAQVTLGILTVYWKKPADVASLHVAVGALVLVTTFFIAVRSIRLYSLGYRASAPSGRPLNAEIAIGHETFV
jgi:cytochrome c oxidase assembly protein subunit 15